MTGREKRIGYLAAWLVIGVLASMSIAVIISVSASKRAVRESIGREIKAREDARRATCGVIRTILAGYTEAPPETATGRELAAAWKTLAVQFNCKE